MKRLPTILLITVVMLVAGSHDGGAGQQETSKHIIVPGVGVGDYALGMSKDEVLKKLGEPETIELGENQIVRRGEEKYNLNNLPRKCILYFGDVSFWIGDDSVDMISVRGPLYKLSNGLGVGDSEQNIKQAFGKDFKREEIWGKHYLSYDAKGLAFAIHATNPAATEIVVRHPEGRPRVLNTLPKYDPSLEKSHQIDLRCRDLSKLDLRASLADLMYADFDDRTIWPAPDWMPSGFDWQKIMELGKNPGLGARRLHEKGITGHGVRIAIIDQPLLVDHQEYADRVRLYEEMDLQGRTNSTMHGAAVASIALGKTVGVAPGAELYYIATQFIDQNTLRRLARSVDRIVEVNRQLPKDNQIRVISISRGWTPSDEGYKDITEAVQKAQAAGILFVCTSVERVHERFDFGVLGRSPLADPEVFESYEPGLFLARQFWSRPPARSDRSSSARDSFSVPMDSRTTASPAGIDKYVFYRMGGMSWAVPYVAGVYALAVQVDPAMTPERFWALAVRTGRTIELNRRGMTKPLGPIIDPVRLIRAIQAGETATLNLQPSSNLNVQAPPQTNSETQTIVPGVRVGDSVEKVKQVYGNDFQLREFENKDIFTYEGKGRSFKINKSNGKVMEINVFQAKRNRTDSPAVLKTLPKYDPDLDKSRQVDLRRCDLSKLDLRASLEDLMYAHFDDRTVWPAPDRMPSGFDWKKIMELGKNPGLGVRRLHERGITGRGVRVAIIDQPLLIHHQEYADRVRLYEGMDLQGRTDPVMHGAMVASIALGKSVGVAPEAELYYIAMQFIDKNTLRRLARSVDRILEVNRHLPKGNKIRVISISKGWFRSDEGYKDITEAVQKAQAAGMLIVCTSLEYVYEGLDFDGLGRPPLADPDVFESYEPALVGAKWFWSRPHPGSHESPAPGLCFSVPRDSRTTASPAGTNDYVFYREGGLSKAVPYIAGVYALAVQADPAITPERFWTLAARTGRTIELNRGGITKPLGPIIDPVRLIRAIQAGETATLNRQPSDDQEVQAYEKVGSKDLRASDLRYAGDILNTLEFNQETLWPPPERLPKGFDPKALLRQGMNPGLGVRALHAQGITGSGVHVGLIDQPLLLDHPEYAGKIVSYHALDCGPHKSSMHGPGMTSELVGKRCGTAPGASLHVVAVPSWNMDASDYARALDRFVTYNEGAPKDQRIRVVSVSAQPSGEGSVYKNQSLWDEAVQRAQDTGILVLDLTWHHGFVSQCWLDPENRESVQARTPGFRNGQVEVDKGQIHVPSAPRTAAEADEDGSFGYAYDGGGRRSRRPKAKNGYSDTIPYTAGILALGWQIRPYLTPAQMKEFLFASAYVHETGAKIIQPKAFIDLVRNQGGH
jgi:subtilisin family serine protease